MAYKAQVLYEGHYRAAIPRKPSATEQAMFNAHREIGNITDEQEAQLRAGVLTVQEWWRAECAIGRAGKPLSLHAQRLRESARSRGGLATVAKAAGRNGWREGARLTAERDRVLVELALAQLLGPMGRRTTLFNWSALGRAVGCHRETARDVVLARLEGRPRRFR
jgi:hypothetical protein